jgi:predicted nuclease of predicted toxin-antitoxin system
MRIKLDENLPYGLVVELSALGHGVDTVPQEGLTGQADDAVWSAAQLSQRFLITQDLDFSDIRKFTPGTHHGLLLVRLQQAGRGTLPFPRG